MDILNWFLDNWDNIGMILLTVGGLGGPAWLVKARMIKRAGDLAQDVLRVEDEASAVAVSELLEKLPVQNRDIRNFAAQQAKRMEVPSWLGTAINRLS